MTITSPLHVAVGVIRGIEGKILLAQRHPDAHQGGLWEFPGGKVEAGESVQGALERELQEELGIRVLHCEPLIQVRHHYPDRSVLLDVWEVLDHSGEPHGNEGQPLAWVEPHQLGAAGGYPLPAANLAIVKALRLPHHCLITGEFSNPADFLGRLQHALAHGIRLVQLRSLESMATLTSLDQQHLAEQALGMCRDAEAQLVINSTLDLKIKGAGLHLSASAAAACRQRPSTDGLLGVSCHNREELLLAQSLNADYVLLSPVAKTSSHPEAEALGWETFEKLVAEINCPVFALGGMKVTDTEEARRRGAQGIAAISAFWKE